MKLSWLHCDEPTYKAIKLKNEELKKQVKELESELTKQVELNHRLIDLINELEGEL